MKKLTVAALLVAMSLSLAACGGNINEQGNVNDTQNVTENVDTQTQDDEDSVNADADTEMVDDTEGAVAVEGTVGQVLKDDFLTQVDANADATAQELADALIANPIIPFAGATMPVEEGLLNGFGNTEVTGFSEGVMFAPMIGSIPFVGYVVTLEEGADAEAFMQSLKDSADLNWNICTAADEMTVEQSGNKVFFLMSPLNFSEN